MGILAMLQVIDNNVKVKKNIKSIGWGKPRFQVIWSRSWGPQNSKFFKKAVFSKIVVPACRPFQWITFPHISAFWAGLAFVKIKFF